MPPTKPPITRSLILLGCGIALLGGGSCRKPKASSESENPPAEIAAELLSNNLADSPSTMLAEQATAPVHWQPFNRTTLERAEKANRLIFAVVILPQQPDYRDVLKSIHEDPLLVRDLNDHFVPTLIDADAMRESGPLSSMLCAEIKRPLGLPLFAWITPQGNFVAWIPVNPGAGDVRELYDHSSLLVSQMWREDPSYVINNSANDNVSRRNRLAGFAKCPPASQHPETDTAASVRKLAAMYDPGSRTLDGCGALFPSGSIDLLSSAVLIPGLPPEVVSHCLETTQELNKDLSGSAMFDPLDGGIFGARLGSGWNLPRFSRDCQSQARATVALLNAQRATGEQGLLDQSLASIGYAEKNFSTQNGLFSMGLQGSSSMESWLWSMEDLEKILSADESKVMAAVSELKGLGNIPPEADPRREYFRRNSLAIRHAPESVASRLGLSPVASRELFESARKKLLKARQERIGSMPNDPRPHAGSTFRMVSVYAAAYAATGMPEWRKKAVETLERARETFSRGPNLLSYPGESNELTSGRAFLYGLAIQAALDVGDITLDANWVSWAEDLASTAGERFMVGDSLSETSKDQSIFDLPLADRSMLFDDSTAGLLSNAQARLAQIGHNVPAVFSSAVSPLPAQVIERPILFTDQLQAALIRFNGPLVLLSPEASPELKEAVSRLPLRIFARRLAKDSDSVGAASAKIVFKDGRTLTASNKAELQTAFPISGRAR